MSKVIIISDTHQNQRLLRTVLQREMPVAEYVFHLGDNYEDLDENEDLLAGKKIVKVPGIFHPQYLDGSIPAIQRVSIKNWEFLLTHNIDDIPEIIPDHQIFLYGHTHRLDFQRADNQYYLNPGHLKDEWDKDRPASYALLDVDLDQIAVLFKDKNGTVIQKNIIHRYE
jgi:hypothetical protein